MSLAIIILVGYLIWLPIAFYVGEWIDDTLYHHSMFKKVLLTFLFISILPAVIMYILGVRSFLYQRWLLIGCQPSQRELLNEFMD